MINSNITVILSVYKRLDNLELQLNAILNQTIKPKYIYIFQDGTNDGTVVEIPTKIKEKVDIFEKSDINVGVWGRFDFAQRANTEYICIFDDDTIPGNRWLENCLCCMQRQEGLYGTNGVILAKPENYPFAGFYNIGWQNPVNLIQEVDFVGHSWFLKTKWLKFLFQNTEELQKFKISGEDMTLSAKLLENGIHTFIPPHPDTDKSFWGSLPDLASQIGADENALSKNSCNLNKYQQCMKLLIKNNFSSLINRSNAHTKAIIRKNAILQLYIRRFTYFILNKKLKYSIRKILYSILMKKLYSINCFVNNYNADKRVSIIIPIYNVEQYLRECLDSVLNQTYKNIEIILVNDGSPDNCDTICKEYAQKYENIKYFYQENKGVSAARNFGLSQATGDYIYFLDSDDTINDIFIESSVDIAEKNNSDLVVVSTNVFKRKSIINNDLVSAGMLELFIKRKILDKCADIKFSENLSYYEDTLFMAKLLLVTDKISVNHNAKYFYRKHSASLLFILSNQPDVYYNSIQECIKQLETFYIKYNLFPQYKDKFSLFLSQEIINRYWVITMDNTKKEEFFELIKNLTIKYELSKYENCNGKLSNIMIQKFVACRKWQDFEKYLILIKIFKFFKKLFKGEIYNAK